MNYSEILFRFHFKLGIHIFRFLPSEFVQQNKEHTEKEKKVSSKKRKNGQLLRNSALQSILILFAITFTFTVTWNCPHICSCLDVKIITKWGLENKFKQNIIRIYIYISLKRVQGQRFCTPYVLSDISRVGILKNIQLHQH